MNQTLPALVAGAAGAQIVQTTAGVRAAAAEPLASPAVAAAYQRAVAASVTTVSVPSGISFDLILSADTTFPDQAVVGAR